MFCRVSVCVCYIGYVSVLCYRVCVPVCIVWYVSVCVCVCVSFYQDSFTETGYRENELDTSEDRKNQKKRRSQKIRICQKLV